MSLQLALQVNFCEAEIGRRLRLDTSPARGMKDYLPGEVQLRNWMLSVILETYSQHGFSQIETPAVENLDRLLGSGGGENEKLIFKILKRGDKLDHADGTSSELADLGLRFDLTVPLARYYANNFAKLPPVLRSIQVGPVWRAERPQRGRLRQFMQCDIDVVGEASVLAELELLSVSLAAISRLGIEAPTLRFNDRRFLDALLSWADVATSEVAAVLILMDKMDKIGREGVIAELSKIALDVGSVAKLETFIRASAASQGLPRDFFVEIGLEGAAIADLEAIAALGDAAANDGVKFLFDPNVIRGMGYYTGPIFELTIDEAGYSIGGGGRYDSMMARFGRPSPACGFSLGFERIALYLAERAAGDKVAQPELYLRCESPRDYAQAKAISDILIAQGIKVAIEGSSRKLDSTLKQLRAANGAQEMSRGAPWVAVVEISATGNRVHRVFGDVPDLAV